MKRRFSLDQAARERLKKAVVMAGGITSVAEQSGLPRVTLANIVNGIGDAGIARVSEVCAKCGVTVDYILTGRASHQPADAPGLFNGLPWRPRRDLTQDDADQARALGLPCSNNAEIIASLEYFFGPDYFKPPAPTRRFDRTREAIIDDLWASGTSLAQVARDNGLDRRLLGVAIRGESLEAYHAAIAKALGVPVHVLWPSLYLNRATQSRGGAAA